MENVVQALGTVIQNLIVEIESGNENAIQLHQNQLLLKYKELSDKANTMSFISQAVEKIVKIDSWKFRRQAQKIISNCVETVFGNDINIISDFYLRLSLELGQCGYCNEAIETAGKNLLMQMENNGVLNDKTAESHFILGSFFIRKALFDDARRELLASRAIYQRIYGEASILVANCDFTIGHVESLAVNYSGAFLSFYKCWYTRESILGKDHHLTKAAESQLQLLRNSSDGLLTCAPELKIKVSRLRWNTFPQKSYQYVISFFLSRLGDDVVMNQEQLHAIITSAIKFYVQTFGHHEVLDINTLATKVCDVLLKNGDITELTKVPPPPQPSILPLRSKVEPQQEVKTNSPLPIKSPSKHPDPRSAVKPLQIKNDHETMTMQSPNVKSTLSLETPPSTESKQPFSRPKAWKTIPPHSPLRTGIDYETQMRTIFSSINSDPCHAHFLHDNTGSLFCVQKCATSALLDILKPKLIAFALLAWYSKNTLKQKVSRKASVVKSAVATEGASSGSSANDPKAALNALFMKRLPPGAGPSNDTKAATLSSSASSSKGQFATDIPIPPPLPTSWPPIPFTKEEASTEESPLTPTNKETVAKPKMKLIHLTGLENTENTFWNEPYEAILPVEELFHDLEEEFLIGLKKKTPVGLQTNKPIAKTPVSKPVAEGVLDPQRSQNISIMLAKFGKKNLDDIAQAVETFDAKALGAAAVSALLQFIPTIDEASKVCNFVNGKVKASQGESDPPSVVDGKLLANLKIGKPEQYVYLFSKVRKLEKKLNAISILLSAPELSESIVSHSETLSNAVTEVKGSGRLKFILRTIVDLNNFLLKQSLSSGGSIAGTPIASWRKLAQVKVNSGETAQQYIVKKLLQHVPESLEFQNDMPSIDEAKSVLLPRLNADLKKLQECLGIIDELLQDENYQEGKEEQNPETTTNNNTAVPSKSIKHLVECQQEMRKLATRADKIYKSASEEFGQVCQYFGETIPPATPEMFFGELSQLCKSIQNISTACGGKQRRK